MKVTIIYDNEAWQPGLEAAWGFSCLVEANGQRLLFDTGGQGAILLQNLKILNLDMRSIPEIFISHEHWDHLGGLADLLSLNRDVRVYLPESCSRPKEAREVISVQGPCGLSGNFFSTGELEGGEQSLVVKTGNGLVVVCGCSHPGVRAILKAASRFGSVSALVGGLHGFKEYEVLADLTLICPCHCTQHQKEIMARYPDTAVKGGAGKVIVFDEEGGVDMRGRFIIDPDGVIVASETLTPPVGRNPAELIRQITAFQHVRTTGEVCPSGWQPGKPTLKPGPELVGKVYQIWKPEQV